MVICLTGDSCAEEVTLYESKLVAHRTIVYFHSYGGLSTSSQVKWGAGNNQSEIASVRKR